MQNLRSLISSPSALFSFEAAARHESFTRAAQELNVSQAAISAAIKGLEAALGVALFHRSHKRIELSEAGKRFYSDVAIGLGHIARSAETIHQLAGDRHVTLSTSTAFASHWMIPRLPSFRAQHPEIDLRLQTSDRDTELDPEAAMLAIRRAPKGFAAATPIYDATFFAEEELFPVCSPSYLAQTGAIRDLKAMAGRKLIHLEEPFRPRPTWRDWFQSQRHDFHDDGEGLRLNDYALVVQAAIGGQGIAMGWAHIVDFALRQGLLVKALDRSWKTGQQFSVITPKSTALAPDVMADVVAVRDWILAAGAVG
jgi:DNA-binding transcriptional LysR family regulator